MKTEDVPGEGGGGRWYSCNSALKRQEERKGGKGGDSSI